MPATSKKQQKFFGMVHAIQKGKLSPKSVSPKMRETAKSISSRDAKDFAETKTKGLPMKKKASIIMQAFNSCMGKKANSTSAFDQGIIDTFTQYGIDPAPFMKIAHDNELIKQALSGSEWAQSVMLAPEYSTTVSGRLADGANQTFDFSDEDRKRAAIKKACLALVGR